MVAGGFGLAAGLAGDRGPTPVGAGAVAIVLGVAGLSPLVASPLAGIIGWPSARLRGIRGQLARANAMRNPRRTAATASALMVALALVAFVAIFAESLRASTIDTIDRVFAADVILQATTFGGVPDAALEVVEGLDEVAVVAPMTVEQVEIEGEDRFVAITTGEELLAVFDFDVVDGDPVDIAAGGIIVAASAAADGMQSSWFIERGSFGASPSGPTFNAYLTLADGVSGADGQAAVSTALTDFPQVTVLDGAGLVEQLGDDVNQLLAVVVALLALSVLIALLGIVNTMALSVVERTREIGLLRAVGMTRAQLRAMIRSEASIVALLAATLGLGLGITFGVVFVGATDAIGVNHLSVPWGQIAVGLVLAALAGLLAGVLPARRAARLDVLDALHTE